MAFVAGAVVGNLILDTKGFTGGIAGAISAATSGGPSIAGPILAALNVVYETARKVFSFVADAIDGLGTRADNLGEAAEKAGVSTEFLSRVGLAASDAGSSVDGLADALKFLNKNAADAAQGEEAAVRAFGRIGISTADVQENLGDTEALFHLVAEAIGQMDTTAEKTAASMALLGRGGSELIPLFNQGAEGLREWAEIADLTGVTITSQMSKAGDAYGKLGTIAKAVWEGFKNSLAEPFLNAIEGDSETFKNLLLDISRLARDLAPLLAQLIASTTSLALSAIKEVLGALQPLAQATDALDLTRNLSRNLGRVEHDVGNVQRTVEKINVYVSGFDPDDASSQIAEKIRPTLKEVWETNSRDLEAAARRGVVAASIGGRTS